VIVFVLGLAALSFDSDEKVEEDQNPDYTRTIHGGDAIDISELEWL
jgi:hypothetical protein